MDTRPDPAEHFNRGIYEVSKKSSDRVTGTVAYYPAAGATLAPHCLRSGCSAGVRIDNTVYYTLKDHLGSASVMTDASGTVVGEQRYYPFGETRNTSGTMLTDKLYTGQREMAGLGLYYYGARFYSPTLGRFISPDTIVPGAANPQSWNRYSYVLNDPVRYTDPTGHGVDCGFGMGCVSSNPRGELPPPDYIDPAQLKKTKHGIEVYKLYVRLYNNPLSWWWRTYGSSDNHFSAMDFIAMMWGYELDVVASDDEYYKEICPDYTEALARSSRVSCERLGCDISSVTGQFVFLSAYSQSAPSRAKDPTPDLTMLNPDRVKGGLDLAAAIQNPAAFGHPEWNDGFANDQPFAVGNESMFLHPPRHWLHKIDGRDPMYVLTGCEFLDAKGEKRLFKAHGCTLP